MRRFYLVLFFVLVFATGLNVGSQDSSLIYYLQRERAVAVLVETENVETGRAALALGGGVIVWRNYVLTVAHLLERYQRIWVYSLKYGMKEAVEIYKDTKSDLAILEVEGLETSSRLVLRRSVVGEHVFWIGLSQSVKNPDIWAFFFLRFSRVMSWKLIFMKTMTEADAMRGREYFVIYGVGPGDSGSPVFGEDGSLVGMVVFACPLKSGENWGGVVNGNEIKKFLESRGIVCGWKE